MVTLNPEEKENLDKLIDVLRKRVPNNELLSFLLKRIDDMKNGIIKISDSYIIYNGFEAAFAIEVNPDTIIEYYKSNRGELIEKTGIGFEGDTITVRKESSVLKGAMFDMPSTISHHKEIREYKDNQIVHERVLHTLSSTSLDSSESFTEERDVFVNDDRIAYAREITIDASTSSKVTYQKCCAYNPKPFNDLEDPQQEQEPFFYESNENEYRTSIAEFTKTK